METADISSLCAAGIIASTGRSLRLTLQPVTTSTSTRRRAVSLSTSTPAAFHERTTLKIPTLDSYNLNSAERVLLIAALTEAGSIVEAAKLLGITRHAVKRRIIKHNVNYLALTDKVAQGAA